MSVGKLLTAILQDIKIIDICSTQPCQGSKMHFKIKAQTMPDNQNLPRQRDSDDEMRGFNAPHCGATGRPRFVVPHFHWNGSLVMKCR